MRTALVTTVACLIFLIVCTCGCGAMDAIDAGFANLDAAVNGIKVLGPRDRLSVGMTLAQVWQACGLDPEEPNRLDPVHEETDGQSRWRTYRCWLRHAHRPQPFLLTFEDRPMPTGGATDPVLVRIVLARTSALPRSERAASIEPDAYGPGIHADQYGRPVREYSWPDGRPAP